MKTLTTLLFTTMMTLPAFAATETESVKEVTDAYVQQHNINVQSKMKAQVNQDILNAVSRFRVPLLTSSVDMLAKTNQNVEVLSEQTDIE